MREGIRRQQDHGEKMFEFVEGLRGEGEQLHVWEVGVGPWQVSHLRPYVSRTQDRLVGVDPLTTVPGESLARRVTLHQCAVVGDDRKMVQVWRSGKRDGPGFQGAYVDGVVSPLGRTKRKVWPTEVKAVRWKDLDPGDIDVLMLDVEGSEVVVLREMVSRPRFLSVEWHAANPHLEEMRELVEGMGYREAKREWDDVWFVREME